MQEQWEKWEPIHNLSANYYIEDITDNDKEFVAVLSESKDKSKKVKIIFENSVTSYTRTDETFRYNTIIMLGNKYGDKFYHEWAFFKIKNSHYLKWLSDQSCGVSDRRPLTHYSILGIDSVLDIINDCEPKVEFIK